jgi:hypothetical protein
MATLRSFLVWIALAAVALSVGTALASQRLTTMQLRGELDGARVQCEDLARLRQENEKLRVRQIPAAQLEALRADHAAVRRMRRELEALEKLPPAPVPQP